MTSYEWKWNCRIEYLGSDCGWIGSIVYTYNVPPVLLEHVFNGKHVQNIFSRFREFT